MIRAISQISGGSLSPTAMLKNPLGKPLTYGGLVAASLKATVNSVPIEVHCHFNPNDITIKKDATWTPTPQIGQNIPDMKFSNGSAMTLTLTNLIFDNTTTMKQENIRKTTDKLWKFIKIDTSLKDASSQKSRPPEVTFTWENFEFVGAVTTMSHSYVFFSELGIPLRAKVTLTLQQITDYELKAATDNPAATALRAANVAMSSGLLGATMAMTAAAVESASASTNSSSSAKAKTSSSAKSSSGAKVVVQEGTRIDHVAAATTGDTSNQRQVAESNNIDNPMKLPKGKALS
jgi:hypothetical protein